MSSKTDSSIGTRCMPQRSERSTLPCSLPSDTEHAPLARAAGTRPCSSNNCKSTSVACMTVTRFFTQPSMIPDSCWRFWCKTHFGTKRRDYSIRQWATFQLKQINHTIRRLDIIDAVKSWDTFAETTKAYTEDGWHVLKPHTGSEQSFTHVYELLTAVAAYVTRKNCAVPPFKLVPHFRPEKCSSKADDGLFGTRQKGRWTR